MSKDIENMSQKELQEAIVRMKKEKDAVILGHYYLRPELQEVSDYVGDSLALAQVAQNAKEKIIVFCGVHFMAETAKILNPEKKVLLPDMSATCSLAECCPEEEFAKFKAEHPGYMVMSYINCSAAIKTMSDLICTSGNAEKLVRALPEDQKIIFAPDRNLGGYINRVTGRNMLLWDGACKVHDAIDAEKVKEMKRKYPEALVVAHPECPKEVLEVSDYIGSTKAMLKKIKNGGLKQVIVVTEEGILYEMERENPDKEFIVVEEKNGRKICCDYMKMNTLEKLYLCLRDETPEIEMDSKTMEQARRPIERMMEMSRELGLI